MSDLAIRRELSGSIDQILPRLELALKAAGFGVLTRIDFDQKIKEKLGQVIPRTVILGACNPKLAFDAFQQTTDVALLIPCNVVIRDIGPNSVIIEAMRPTKMLDMLPAIKADSSIEEAENRLAEAMESL